MTLVNKTVRGQVRTNKEDVRELQGEVYTPFKRVIADSARGVGGGGNLVHKAFLKTVPGAVSVADCYLDTDTTGDEIEVNFSISRGTALNAALPRLQDGDLLFVQSFGGTWWCVQTFHGSEDCVCS